MLLLDAYVRPSWGNASQMEHPLAVFDPEIPGKFPVLLVDCNGAAKVVTYIKKWCSSPWEFCCEDLHCGTGRGLSCVSYSHLKQPMLTCLMCNIFSPKKSIWISLTVIMYSQENGTSNTFSCWNLLEAGRDAKSQILCCMETFCTVRTMGPERDGSSHYAIHSVIGQSLAPVASAAGGRQNAEDRRWQE